MKRFPYRLAADTLGDAEIASAKAVLDSRMLTMSREVRTFEQRFADWVGARNAVMVNSGSSANLLMVDALLRGAAEDERLLPGDEVIVPALAWPTTVWPLAQLGLVPVFVDVDPSTLAIDLDSARAVLGPRTRAMFLIHALGQAGDLDAYDAFCRQHGLRLIEDGCESLGAHSQGRHVGTVGWAGSFSFYFSHHISTIEGGMVITSDDRLADELRGLRAHGWIRDRSDRDDWISRYPGFDPRFLFATLGYNVRPTEIQGAIGIVQLDRLDTMLAARETLAREVAQWLSSSAPWIELIGSDHLADQPRTRSARTHSWMTLPMRLAEGTRVSRDDVVRCLEENGVETRPIIAGNLARHPATAGIPHRTAAVFPVADSLLERGLMIGCHPIMDAPARATLEVSIRALKGLPT